jgi:hypothetical protein
MSRKFEAQSTKFETNPKYECSNAPNLSEAYNHFLNYPVLVIMILKIRYCFGFRDSDFEFMVLILSIWS